MKSAPAGALFALIGVVVFFLFVVLIFVIKIVLLVRVGLHRDDLEFGEPPLCQVSIGTFDRFHFASNSEQA